MEGRDIMGCNGRTSRGSKKGVRAEAQLQKLFMKTICSAQGTQGQVKVKTGNLGGFGIVVTTNFFPWKHIISAMPLPPSFAGHLPSGLSGTRSKFSFCPGLSFNVHGLLLV